MFVICRRPSVCRLSVCNVGAPYSGDWNFRQYFCLDTPKCTMSSHDYSRSIDFWGQQITWWSRFCQPVTPDLNLTLCNKKYITADANPLIADHVPDKKTDTNNMHVITRRSSNSVDGRRPLSCSFDQQSRGHASSHVRTRKHLWRKKGVRRCVKQSTQSHLRQDVNYEQFKRQLKTFLFAWDRDHDASSFTRWLIVRLGAWLFLCARDNQFYSVTVTHTHTHTHTACAR